MIYEYYCESCNKVYELEKSMQDEIPASVPCPHCKKDSPRLWNNISVIIPEFFKATSELYNQDTGANFDYIKQRMKILPSGREKIYY
ncbi:MAG TPA: zinc ribbon domain-containing protein [Candidatus Pacearchaeota archaeon]|nr:zinc ribbon domain-containing protein [Candidatus Pacearchaeota archaeon]